MRITLFESLNWSNHAHLTHDCKKKSSGKVMVIININVKIARKIWQEFKSKQTERFKASERESEHISLDSALSLRLLSVQKMSDKIKKSKMTGITKIRSDTYPVQIVLNLISFISLSWFKQLLLLTKSSTIRLDSF